MNKSDKFIKSRQGKILLLDNQNDYLHIAASLLEQMGYIVRTSSKDRECLSILHHEHFDLLFLDYPVQGESNSIEIITEIREFNLYIQIILKTSDDKEIPQLEMLEHLNILGYFNKNNGTDSLLLWINAGLKAVSNVQLLDISRQGLRYILSFIPDMFKILQGEELLQEILLQLCGLFNMTECFIALIKSTNQEIFHDAEPEEFIAMIEGEYDAIIQVGTGKFKNPGLFSGFISPDIRKIIIEVLNTRNLIIKENTCLIPIRAGDQILGLIYFEHINPYSIYDMQLLNIFTEQVAIAAQGNNLYQTAMLDIKSGVFTYSFMDKCLLKELWLAYRFQKPLTVLLVALVEFREITEATGWNTGDKVLTLAGNLIRSCIRVADYIGRYSDNEFILILPETSRQNSLILCNRILETVNNKTLKLPEGDILLKINIGVCGMEVSPSEKKNIEQLFYHYYKKIKDTLIQNIKSALLKADANSEATVYYNPYMQW